MASQACQLCRYSCERACRSNLLGKRGPCILSLRIVQPDVHHDYINIMHRTSKLDLKRGPCTLSLRIVQLVSALEPKTAVNSWLYQDRNPKSHVNSWNPKWP